VGVDALFHSGSDGVVRKDGVAVVLFCEVIPGDGASVARVTV
jgi:hypothetical protein